MFVLDSAHLSMGTGTLGSSTPVLTLGHCLLCLVSVLCPPCLLSLSPEDLFDECWGLLGSPSDSLDPFLYFCLPVHFCRPEIIPWLTLSTYSLVSFNASAHLLGVLLQSSYSSFLTSLRHSFLWLQYHFVSF